MGYTLNIASWICCLGQPIFQSNPLTSVRSQNREEHILPLTYVEVLAFMASKGVFNISRFQTPVMNVSILLVKSPSSRYVAACAKSTSGLPLYDLIVMDVFDGEGETPEAFLTEDFGTLVTMDVSWDFAWDFTINVLDVTMEYRVLLAHLSVCIQNH